MNDIKIKGHCFCGAVQYEASCALSNGSEGEAGVCYCDDCARACGAPIVAWTCFSPDKFKFVKGEPVHFESSPGVDRTFCGRCGTSLTYKNANDETIAATVASLDDPASVSPNGGGPPECKPAWLMKLASK